MKRCSSCGEKKDIGEFYKNRSMSDGFSHSCKLCQRSRGQQWRKANPGKAREFHQRYREANPDESRDRNQRWREANPERAREASRRWDKENPDKKHAKQHRYRASLTGNGGSYTVQEWTTICACQAYRCACCGDKKPLTVDHILPVSMGGKNYISNIQALCGKCNSTKNTKHIDYRLDWT